jgi:hypothetical protein
MYFKKEKKVKGKKVRDGRQGREGRYHKSQRGVSEGGREVLKETWKQAMRQQPTTPIFVSPWKRLFRKPPNPHHTSQSRQARTYQHKITKQKPQ